MTTKFKEWIVLPIAELDSLLSYSHPQHQELFLQTNWISSNRGFRLNKNVLKTTTEKKINPRFVGKILFKSSSSTSGLLLASEVIKCSGAFCDKFCQVSLKLKYTEKDVKISFSTTDHGMNFKPAISRLKLSKQTRNDIIVNDKGGYGTTPVGEFVTISRQVENLNQTALNSAILPSKKQIANILDYERRKKQSSNEEKNILHFIQKSKSVIYPSKESEEITDPFIIVMKARDYTIQQFVENHRKLNLIGIDSQYVNNKYRLPLTVMVTTNENHNCIPGFIMLSSQSDARSYSKFIRVVTKYLQANCSYTLTGYCMHDKDDSEFLACKNNNLIS